MPPAEGLAEDDPRQDRREDGVQRDDERPGSRRDRLHPVKEEDVVGGDAQEPHRDHLRPGRARDPDLLAQQEERS